MGELLDRREEALAHVIRVDALEEVAEQLFVLGPHRADAAGKAALGDEVALPFGGIGTDGEARMAAAHQAPGAGRADGDAGVQRDDAAGIGQQRIDVDLGDLRKVGCELRESRTRISATFAVSTGGTSR